MQEILCVGDSLTFGARDEYHRSYPAELSKIFWQVEKKEVYCINRGISGETSGQLLKRIYNDVNSCHGNTGLLLIGSNDTFISTPADVYEDNLRQTLMVMKNRFCNVGIGLLPPIIGPGLLSYPKNANQQVKKYNEVILDVAEKYSVFASDFSWMGEYIIDTVHFGNEGYKKMAQVWYTSMLDEGVII